MAYVGNQPSKGQWRKLTDISAGFNGSTASFTLSVPPGTSQYYVTPGSASQLIISVGGVIQQPDVDYTVSAYTITFTTAPATGLSFFGVLAGDALNIGTPADGSVTDVKLASLTTVNVTNLKNPSSGSNNIVLNTDGTTTIAAPNNIIKSGTAVASTSGVSIDFTGIPSWVKRVTVMFNGVSTNGTSSYLIQLGTGASPTYLTSAYSGSVVRAAASTTFESTNSTGFRIVDTIAAASTNFGTVNLANITGNTWVESGVVCLGNVGSSNTSGGSVSLSAALTAIRITTVNGTDTFDAGTINILYEG